MSCNPCSKTSLTNTAACESLPSQIENFTKQFFGVVVKTEVDGVVNWSLPCNLDVGLPNNARGVDEGLACYFLRLFLEGIVGLTGPDGAPGAAGAAGRNAYTVTLQAFAQPTPGNPNVQILTAYNAAILPGLYVFIDTSGWYQVSAADTSGVLFLVLHTALPGAPAVINAGKLVVPSGVPGANGFNGTNGTNGTNGINGVDVSTENDFYFATVGTDHVLGIVYAAVDFVNSSPSVTLPSAGTYRVSVVADLVGLPTVLATEKAFLKLRNTTTSTDIAGSEHLVSNFADTIRSQITIVTRVITTLPSQQIALFGKADTATKISVVALNTTVAYERLS